MVLITEISRMKKKDKVILKEKSNYLLTVAYDGSGFVGWQYQPAQRTVQGTLNQVLKAVFKQDIKVDGAGRTDAGVHALGQLATFSMEGRVKPDKMKKVLNHALPGDVRIVGVKEVPEDFHARYHSVGKTYVYKLKNVVPDYAESALESKYYYFVEKPLDVEAMRKAAECFVGKHDFKNYCASGHGKKSTVRKIKSIEIEEIVLENSRQKGDKFKASLRQKSENFNQINQKFLSAEEEFHSSDGETSQNPDFQPKEVIIRVTGEGFLWKMVRMIVQTLVDVGVGAEKPSNVAGLLKKKNRKKEAAPAGGLYLEKVFIAEDY